MAVADRKRRSAYRLAVFPYRSIALVLASIGLSQLALAIALPGWFAMARAAGLLFATLPALCVGVTINHLRDRIVVLRLLRWRTARLSDFSRLLLYRSDSRVMTYIVAFAGRGDGSPPLPCLAFQHYVDARSFAERIARFAALDIHDWAFGPPTVRGRLRAAAKAWHAPRLGSEPDVTLAAPDEAAFSSIRDFDGDPDILSIRHKVTTSRFAVLLFFLTILGAPLFAVGLMFGAAVSTGIVACLLVITATMSVILPRRGIVFLHGRNVCYTWRYIRTRGRMLAHPLAAYTDVTLTSEMRSGARSEDLVHYCVRLDGESEPLEIQETPHLPDARAIADRVARFLGLELRDFTTSRPTVETKSLLHLKIFQSPDRRTLPALSADSRIRLKRIDGAYVFRIPTRGLGWSIFAVLIVVACPFVCLLAMAVLDPQMLMRGKAPAWVMDTITGACALGLFISLIAIVVVIYPFVRARLRREKIIVTPERVRVESRSFLRKAVVQVGTDDLTDITIAPPISAALLAPAFGHFVPAAVVRVAESSRVVEFGGHLSHADRIWLRAAVAAILLTAPTPDA